MQKNLLSVIIPTFERQVSVVERAVKSIQTQTYPYIEIVIVDDNNNNSLLSSDIKKYCKKNGIIYIKQFGNSGACNARNIGVVNSHGEYIAFLDDDDEWLPSKASEQIAMLKKGYGLVFSKGLNVYANLNFKELPYGNNSNFIQEPEFEDLLIKNYIGTTSQIMTTRECFFSVNGFDPDFPAHQDYDFCLRVSQYYRLYGIDHILFKHYHHSQYQITQNINHTLNGYLKLYIKYKPFYQKRSMAYINICCKISKSYLHKRKYFLWGFWMIKAFIKCPTKLKIILCKSTEKKVL